MQVFSSCGKWGLLFVVRRLLTAAAPLVEPRLWACRLQRRLLTAAAPLVEPGLRLLTAAAPLVEPGLWVYRLQ